MREVDIATLGSEIARHVLTRALRLRGPVPQGIGLVPLAQILADLDRDRENRF